MKARTLLLLYGLSLAATAAADPIGAPRQGAEGWFFGPRDERYDLQRRMPHTGRDSVVPLPRPRPYVLERMGATGRDALNPVSTGPATAQTPESTPLAPSGSQNASTSQPVSAPLSAAEQRAADDGHRQTDAAEAAKWAAPIKDNGGAAMPSVSVSDAGGGRVRIEAHEASLAQVLAALQDSHRIQFSASDPLSGTVTGTYTGTLPQVLSRILEGHNYFLRVTASGTELHAVNASAVGSPAAASVPAFSPPGPAFDAPTRVTPSPAGKPRARSHDD